MSPERRSERQKQGIDGEAPRAKDLKKAGESANVQLDAPMEDVVDPTGHVSSGLQPPPARGMAEREPMGRDDLTPITDPEKPEKAKNERE